MLGVNHIYLLVLLLALNVPQTDPIYIVLFRYIFPKLSVSHLTYLQIDRWIDRQIDRWINRGIDRQIDGQIDRQLDRQMDRYKDGHLTNNKAENQIMTKPFLKLVLFRPPTLTGSINNNSYYRKYPLCIRLFVPPPFKEHF